MASFIIVFCLLFSAASAASSFRPKALVLPISRDPSTLQYRINLTQRTPPINIPLTLDLGGPFLWVDCDKNYISTTYRSARCNSAQCSLANSKSCGTCNAPPRPGCNNNTCGLFPENPFINTATSGELASDVIRITSTDGSNPGPVVKVPNFLFSCAPTSLLKGLSKSVQGIAGLGSTKISPPSQFSSAFSFARKFAICLPSLSEGGNGALFFGDGPYKFFFETDLVSLLTFTPLVTNHVSTGATSFAGEPSSEYFIKVNQLRINNKVVPINKPLLSIDSKGNGGTKLSTTIPYTLMQTSIYKSFINVFVNELRITNVTIVKTIAPFNVCVDPSTFPASRGTDGVPWINFELDGASQAWTLIGGNSFVRVNKDVSCLGIMDGGEKPRTSIVIGGLQLEDNLVQVDMAKSRIGFSSSLRISRTSCSMFNFTSIA
ncbi:hypothetical protein BVRB_008150 [Beta vulgaris subsp. vulgaris]|uniref:Peptidase A1 domain-containing protein n=1 Tax=Beta vulgaris subsp. vulgaris TaxID=3555 RepID=A0A0J8DX57_BETVV|nr:probable aspartic proteinase GIP2 [Beta vulgaris subsp. vulgaris]KMS95450.1 hypothetical protein BVRB_008150 [Beta vulgaris subsp. vulgaris]